MVTWTAPDVDTGTSQVQVCIVMTLGLPSSGGFDEGGGGGGGGGSKVKGMCKN